MCYYVCTFDIIIFVMPRLIYDVPNWGYDLLYMQKHKYSMYMKQDLIYIDTVRSYQLYMSTNGDYIKHFVLLDHENEVMKYISTFMDNYHNNIYSQCIVWRDLADITLKGIALQCMTDYYIDIFKTIYSDDTQTLHGKKLWHQLIMNTDLKSGFYNTLDEAKGQITDYDELYRSANRDHILLYVEK